MKFSLNNFSGNLYNFFRDIGYHKDRFGADNSYIRSLSGGRYPRFHIYYNAKKREIDIHLDQKPARYKHANDHAGEYSGKIVEEEVERIKSFL